MDSDTLRILDASLNRASEGLRVVEDYARFVLDDALLSRTTKELRHELAQLATDYVDSSERHAARDTPGDVGTAISTDSETSRQEAWDVCAASLNRLQQSLRSLEEYGKLVSARFAGECEQLRYRTYTLEKALDTTRTSLAALAGSQLCVLIDGKKSNEQFASSVSELVDAGVHLLQLRDKQLEDRELVQRARALVDATRGSHSLAIINDRADIAAASHADGVHLGQEDLSVGSARTILGAKALIGVSTHGIEQARQAVRDGANYLGAGPTFPSQTKTFESFPGLGYLLQVSAEIALPTFAIGGIHSENVAEVLASGATRIAVGAAVTQAACPGAAAKLLLHQLKIAPPTSGRG